MKKILFSLAIGLFLSSISYAQSENSGFNLTVKLTGLSKDKGVIKVGLYDKEGKWLKENYKGEEVVVKGGSGTIVFENLPSGEYAISTFHDINSNDELDSNAMGIPKEPYAFSNDAKGFFGPASFKDAKFEVNNNSEISIKF